MAHNWKKHKLIEVINLIGGGTPKTSVKEYWGGDIPWLSVVDFNNGQKRVYDAGKKITKLGLENSSTKILKKGQLIISARGGYSANADKRLTGSMKIPVNSEEPTYLTVQIFMSRDLPTGFYTAKAG